MKRDDVLLARSNAVLSDPQPSLALDPGVFAGVPGLRARVDLIPDVAIQIAPRLDPTFTPLPPGVTSIDPERVRALLAELLGLPEVRHVATGPSDEKGGWLSASETTFGAWSNPTADQKLEGPGRDQGLRDLELLRSEDHAQVIGSAKPRLGLRVPLGYIQDLANGVLAEEGFRQDIGEHTTARIDRAELRRGPREDQLDTTVHGVLLRDGIRRNYHFVVTVRDTLNVGHERVGSHLVGVVTSTPALLDAGVDGLGGDLLRLLNQALALTRGGFIAGAIVKTVMRVLGLFPGLRALQGEDYLNLAIELGLVSGDRFSGLGAVAGALLPRQILIPRDDPRPHPVLVVPVQGPVPLIQREKKLMLDLTDVEIVAGSLQVRGTGLAVDREPSLRLVGGGFVFDSASKTLRGPATGVPFDLRTPFESVAWTVTGGSADPADELTSDLEAPVQAAFMPLNAKLDVVDADGVRVSAKASFVAGAAAAPGTPSGGPVTS